MSAETTRVEINTQTRNGLRLLTELILPGTTSMPSGTSVGAHDTLLDAALVANPRLITSVSELGHRAGVQGAVQMDDLLNWGTEQVEELVFALNAAYYMSGEVRRSLGYPGQIRMPLSATLPVEQYDEQLLAPVLERGSIYVPTPPASIP